MANIEHATESISSATPTSASLVFVNVSNPAAVDSSNIRRLVRSSATRHSHRDPTRKPKTRRAGRKRGASSSTPHASLRNEHSNESRADSLSDAETDSSRRGSEQLSTRLFKVEDRRRVVEITNNAENVASPIRLLEQYTSQPNNSYPVEAEEWFPWVLSHYRTVYLPLGIASLQNTKAEGEWFVDWFMDEGLAEPALFYTQLLSACSSLVNEDRVPQERLLWLRGMVVRSINEAISAPTRALTTGTFLAIALIALHEYLYGDKTLATDVHGRAFARMTEMAGGIEHLVIPKIAWKILLWIDNLLLASDGVLDPLSTLLLEAWVPEKLRVVEPG